MEYQPLDICRKIWESAKSNSTLKQKSAVCISTIGNDEYPNARFVDLKEIDSDGFIFCTSYESQKSRDIHSNNKISLTAWWEEAGYQLRVKGKAVKIETTLADQYWDGRSENAKTATYLFKQSDKWEHSLSPQDFFQKLDRETVDLNKRPNNWGGFKIMPKSIEILHFQQNRAHQRQMFEKVDDDWHLNMLQP